MQKKNYDCSVAIQVLPNTTEEKELIRIVDAVIAHIKSYGLHTVVSPFETVIEGDYDTLMQIVKECQIVAVENGCPGLMSYVKINFQPKGVLTIDEKTKKHQ